MLPLFNKSEVKIHLKSINQMSKDPKYWGLRLKLRGADSFCSFKNLKPRFSATKGRDVQLCITQESISYYFCQHCFISDVHTLLWITSNVLSLMTNSYIDVLVVFDTLLFTFVNNMEREKKSSKEEKLGEAASIESVNVPHPAWGRPCTRSERSAEI